MTKSNLKITLVWKTNNVGKLKKIYDIIILINLTEPLSPASSFPFDRDDALHYYNILYKYN